MPTCSRTDRPVLDQLVYTVPIRSPKIKQHWLQSILRRVKSLNWPVKRPRARRHEVLVSLCCRQVLDFTTKKPGETSPLWSTKIVMAYLLTNLSADYQAVGNSSLHSSSLTWNSLNKPTYQADTQIRAP